MDNSTQAPLTRDNHKKKKAEIKAWPRALKKIITWRRAVQAGIGFALYLAVSEGWMTIGWIIIIGSAMGIVFGKIFCRWMCPMGFLMELMMNAGGENSKGAAMYQYFKLGCPIAWISGILNRISILRVKLDVDACVSCGKCDTVCYIAINDENRSLHLKNYLSSSAHYACSRCLKCVESCPTGALGFSPGIGQNTIQPSSR